MSLASRLRALERNTERLRHQLLDRCPECGARVDQDPVGVIIVDESQPPDEQATDLARADLLGHECSTCGRYVDDGGRALPGQGEHVKVIWLEKDAERREPERG